MRGLRQFTMTAALLMMALLPLVASVSPEVPAPAMDSRMPVAMAQPLAAVDGAPLVVVRQDGSDPTLSESTVLLLIGSALFGLAAIVRRTT